MPSAISTKIYRLGSVFLIFHPIYTGSFLGWRIVDLANVILWFLDCSVVMVSPSIRVENNPLPAIINGDCGSHEEGTCFCFRG